MRVLKVLGWLFIPFIFIFFRWKHLNTLFRTVGICWSVLLLSIVINNSPQQNPVTSVSAASVAGQPTNKITQAQTTTTPVKNSTNDVSKTSPKQTTVEQKAKLDAEIEQAKNGSYQDKMKALKDYITIDKSDLLTAHPTIRDMGFAGDLFIQTNKNTVKEFTSVGDQFISKSANGVYWEVEVTVSNAGTNPLLVNTNMFTLTTSDGRKFSADTEAETMISKSIIMNTLNPGVEETGYLIFDMPKGFVITDAVLNVQNGFNHTQLKIS